MWLPLCASNLPSGKEWVEQAYQFGPFAFSILFLLVLLSWVASKHSTAKPDDKLMWRRLLYSTYGIGVGLVAVCTWWWLATRITTYVFQGRIEDLAAYEQLGGGTELYFRNEWKTLSGTVDDLRRNVYFMVVQPMPFKKGQSFRLEFAKGTSAPRSRFDIVFDPGDSDPTYEIVWDEKSQLNTLRRKGSPPPGPALGWTPFSGVVLAQSMPVAKPRRAMPLSAAELNAIVEVLQSDRSDVGARIVAVERVLDSGSAREVLRAPGNGTSMIATFYGLSRHSDPELASKARRVLDAGGAVDLLAEDFAAGSPARRAEAKATLAQMPAAEAEAVLAGTKARNPVAAKSVTVAARPASLPVPTGSSQGDRYYVKATWDPKQPATVSCLTELFDRELIGHRTRAEEAALMRGRSWRLVYWYSSEWAVQIADGIRKCGANAEFVQP
jgi:hypothetical protein